MTKDVPPKKFAAAAKERGTSFEELLAFIARLFMGGQSQAQERQEVVRKSA